MHKGTGILAGVALLALLLNYPFDVTVVPEWNVKVVDERGRPIPGAFVSEFANQWTLDFEHGSAVCTDRDGEVPLSPPAGICECRHAHFQVALEDRSTR